MSLGMQKKLLRVLQDGEIRAVGGNEVIHVDVRIISASNKNLHEMVRHRLFREDLYFRLNTVTLDLPSLRERKEDIPDLVRHFVERTAQGTETAVTVSKDAMAALVRYPWPGNIRELENEIRRCMALKGEKRVIDLDDLSEDVKNC
jgi:transcriptional regulator with PAS, ATPase and Fis domain